MAVMALALVIREEPVTAGLMPSFTGWMSMSFLSQIKPDLGLSHLLTS